MPQNAHTDAKATAGGRLTAESLDEVLGYQLALSTVLTDGVFDEAVRKPCGLRTVEFALLALVCEHPGATPVRLAKALHVTAASITMMVLRMTESNLLRREAGTTDRRAQHLYATEQGQQTLQDAIARIRAGEAERLAGLSFAERVMLLELLRKVARLRR